MAPQSDLQKPTPDPYVLVGDSWPQESESSYHAAEAVADDAATTAATQAQSATDAGSKMNDEKGETADSVSGGYSSAASQLSSQGHHFTAISGWMSDAAGKVDAAKRHIRQLVRSGTSEVRAALESELQGTSTSPSSTELTIKYRSDIAAVKSKLGTDLDSIGHALHGDSGASRTPTYVRAASTPTTPTVERAAVHQGITGDQPQVAPTKLPEMPRATTSSTTESASGASAPVAPHSVNPTLANLIGGGQPTGAPSTSSPRTSSQGSPSPSPQAHQAPEQRQTSKPAGLPHIPSLPLDGLPAATAESVATVVSSATAHQLPTAPSTITPSIPAPTGFTPGVAGTPPVTPMAPTPLTPIGGGGLTPPAVQPAPQGTSASPSPAPQQTTTTPSPAPRGPVADLAWIQRNYGLAAGLEVPKPESAALPALFITDLPDDEANLHRVLATLRQAFESAGWSQPLAVGLIKRGLETRLVYVTSDGLSIHPSGILLPVGVIPLDEIPSVPSCSEMAGSIMVSEKLKALVPRNWEVESVLSTVTTDEQHQSAEQFQELVGAVELVSCKVSRGRGDVTGEEAMSTFARAALGAPGCSDLDVESARLRGSRWIGVQPAGYGEVLSRWYLSDAAESMSRGAWGEAVYSAEKYLSIMDTKSQAA